MDQPPSSAADLSLPDKPEIDGGSGTAHESEDGEMARTSKASSSDRRSRSPRARSDVGVRRRPRPPQPNSSTTLLLLRRMSTQCRAMKMKIRCSRHHQNGKQTSTSPLGTTRSPWNACARSPKSDPTLLHRTGARCPLWRCEMQIAHLFCDHRATYISHRFGTRHGSRALGPESS